MKKVILAKKLMTAVLATAAMSLVVSFSTKAAAETLLLGNQTVSAQKVYENSKIMTRLYVAAEGQQLILEVRGAGSLSENQIEKKRFDRHWAISGDHQGDTDWAFSKVFNVKPSVDAATGETVSVSIYTVRHPYSAQSLVKVAAQRLKGYYRVPNELSN